MNTKKILTEASAPVLYLIITIISFYFISEEAKIENAEYYKIQDRTNRTAEYSNGSTSDKRIWSITNIYTPELQEETGLQRNSEYMFTKDSVFVINYHSESISEEFTANK